MQQRPRRVFAYTRVSSEDQERHGTSLPAQRAELVAYCERRGWPSPTVVAEVESGGAERLDDRVELQRLLATVKSGDAVVVSRADRWSRDLPHAVASVRALVARGVGWFSAGENIDASDPQGDNVLGMMAWSADAERKRIKERTLGARRRMRNAGCWTEGVAPFGYRRDALTRKLAIVEADAVHVREMFTACINGRSVAGIMADWNDRGIHRDGGPPVKWHKKGIHTMLRAQWYVGDIRDSEGNWQPAHDGIVTRTVFQQAQDAMVSRAHGGRLSAEDSRTAGWLLRGLAYCSACGSRMGSAYGPSGWQRSYYACSARTRGRKCGQPYVRVDDIDASAADALVGRLEELREVFATQEPPASKRGDVGVVEKLRKQVATSRGRRERVLSMAIDGDISREELRTRLARIDAETVRLESKLAEEEARLAPVSAEAKAEALRDVKLLRKCWGRMPVENRREVLVHLAKRTTFNGAEVTFQWSTPESLCTSAVDRNLLMKTVRSILNVARREGLWR